ncbi:THUMP domain-containing class I SAM-dependent RNA methyltransferase [Ohtaekwangia koreensis]|uniref:Putative N6-adenine-specific DNA methylase n=1 Tax=Ohtaekwangia koreensis TaxID=688867 RepID=A0A1T5JIC5_9BACT|nr:RNA methyltransferase [Ohtaekwangia koreensis]SKC51200.1 putative N6-adenine-specific DNA methylase [Ohtaekwangia koreensis]
MNIFSDRSRIIITCNKRLTPYLELEVTDLGFTLTRTFQTGVELEGTVADCIRLNLNLRCASQVHYSLKEFHAEHPEALYDVLVRMPWENILSNDKYISVTCTVDQLTVNNEMFVNVKVKDAIVDRLRRETSVRPDSGPDMTGVVIHVYWKEDRGEVFIDTSGETLAKHGYRKIPGKAPMLEALASATIMASKWDRQSPFINPMCGSGTMAIEAALFATNRRPGLYRSNYSFMHLKNYDEQVYQTELRMLHDQIKEVPDLLIEATDISDDAINISKINAGIAGVEKYIQFAQCDFALTEVPEGKSGVVYFNPEYGERLGEIDELEITYARIGDFLKQKCKGYTGYIFTGNLDLAKKIGLKARRRIEFYNAKLDCRLLEYELYAGSKESDRKEKERKE